MKVVKARVKQGEIWRVNLTPQIGNELKDVHACVILQKDAMNENLLTTIVAPFVKDTFPRGVRPLHAIQVPKSSINKLDRPRWIDISQIRCVDATMLSGLPAKGDDLLEYRFESKQGELEDEYFWQLENAFYATFKDIFNLKPSSS